MLIIFGMLNPVKIWHENLTDLFTSPVWRSHFTSGNPKKSFSTIFWSFMLSQKKTICNPLTHPSWKCHHTNLWTAKLFNLNEGLLRSFKRHRLSRKPVVGCHQWLWTEPVVKWQLECQAVSQQVLKVTTFCVSTCFQVFFDTDQSQSTQSCAEIQTTSQKATAVPTEMK